MPIDYDKIKNWPFPDIEQTYTEKDSILYALGVGYGHDPMDEAQLQFVYEQGLKAAPTMPVVLANPGFWVKDPATGIDWVKIVHGEQALRIHQTIPATGTVIGRMRVKAIVDKGKDKGALLIQERSIVDKASGALLATLEHTTFCRGDGGFGKGDAAPPPPPAPPEGKPDVSCDLPTLPQSALIYRLCADRNPLHADPAVAKAAGFPRPILHGLCSYGVAGHAILKTFCGYDPSKLTALSLRFSAPVFPGETIRTEMWNRGETILFRSRVLERDVVVLNNGVATINA
ncbi:MAG: MaoC family dehydratase N-terminal domain-containing protein [Burkholderiales bacterium]|nr:MaoC family dehydratase N-terminal domain-containing protein [Burkholderiales bacterium]